MGKRGKVGWIPAIVLEEVENIKMSDGISYDADALKRMVDNARKGRVIGLEIAEINRKLPEPLRIGRKKKGRIGSLFD